MTQQHRTRTQMRTSVLLLAMAISACSTSQSITGNNRTIEEEVSSRFRSLIDAAESLDNDAYFSHFDERLFTSLNENGTVTNSFEAFRHDYLAGVETISAYQHLEFKNVTVSVIDPHNAVLVNEYEATVQLKDGSVAGFSGAGSQVWHMSSGEWLLVSVSSSSTAD